MYSRRRGGCLHPGVWFRKMGHCNKVGGGGCQKAEQVCRLVMGCEGVSMGQMELGSAFSSISMNKDQAWLLLSKGTLIRRKYCGEGPVGSFLS